MKHQAQRTISVGVLNPLASFDTDKDSTKVNLEFLTKALRAWRNKGSKDVRNLEKGVLTLFDMFLTNVPERLGGES